MKTREENELENLALAAELARQLCHDFSNFVYNFLLQIEISEAGGDALKLGGWEGVKPEARAIARRLQEWQQFHDRFSFDETMIDLHAVIRQAAAAVASQGHTVRLGPTILAGPLSIAGFPAASRHLLRLVLEDTFHHWQQATGTIPAVSIETETAATSAIVRVTAEFQDEAARLAAAPADAAGADADQDSLMAATCRSLTVRLGASLQREQLDRGSVIHIGFPLGLTGTSQ